ncbi:MAG TPA: VanZ family protein [Lachnospiraceae bacterium]|nr:VanZ family protein [Lachnospiraceae bacterium]
MKYVKLFVKTFLRTLLKPLSFVPAICMMLIIYGFSGQDGADSSRLSYQVSHAIVKVADKVLDKDLSEAQIDAYAEKYHHLIRKMAHFTEYLLLGASVALPLYVYGLRGFALVFFTGAFCVGFACLDEFHQSFVAGRGPSKKDVVIDSLGSFTGIYCTRIFGFVGRKTVFAPLAKKKDK